jgi:eukaryotic-like serine/threonine-protein kinase
LLCDDNALVELADGLLAPARKAAVLAHVDGCTSCRGVLAGLARSETDTVPRPVLTAPASTAATRPSAPVDAAAEVVPAQLLREYLARDAPLRERTIAMFWGGLALITMVLFALVPPARGGRFAAVAMIIQGVFFAHEAALYLALRRGWYRPNVPFMVTLTEVTVVFAMQLASTLDVPPDAVAASPGSVLVAVLVVFTAIRADPRISLAAGVVAASETLVLYFLVRGRVEHAESAEGLLWRAGMLVAAGVAGALVAGHLVRRAEQALRDVREQDLLGKYLLHERLGTGGMGEVFRATYCPEGGFTRTVAVKRVRDDLSRDPQFEAYFRNEARLGAALAHPNLVQVLDCGKLRGAFMLAMDHVDGVSLARLLRKAGPLPPRAVAYVGAELATALEYLHGRRAADGSPLGLVHCDVNPPNVLVSRLGEVKLADFGVARAAGRGGFGGKLTYAAPEQLRGDDLDGRADVFGLGLVLHEALTGRHVFARGENALDTHVDPPSAHAAIPHELDALVMSLLALDPAARPTALEVRTRLRALPGDLAPYPAGEEILASLVPGR